MGRYVILGNGVAGTRAAEMLRDLDQDAEIVVVTEEVHPFYRPVERVNFFGHHNDLSVLIQVTEHLCGPGACDPVSENHISPHTALLSSKPSFLSRNIETLYQRP